VTGLVVAGYFFAASVLTNVRTIHASGPEVGDVFRVNTDGESDDRGDREPFVLPGENGLWSVFWSAWDAPDGSPDGDLDIYLSRSTDDGRTWSPPSQIGANAATDLGNDSAVAVASDGEGNLVAIWSSTENLTGTINTDEDVFVATSDDEGLTWSAPAILNSGASSDNWPDQQPAIVTDGQGTWIAAWKGNGSKLPQPATTDLLVSRSVDNGTTWSVQTRIDLAWGDDVGNDRDPEFATDGQGTWLVVWARDDPDAPVFDIDIVFSRSTDAGLNWTAPSVVNSYAASDGVEDFSPTVTTDGKGAWLVTWATAAVPPGGEIGANTDILYARSVNNGATWSTAAPVSSIASSDAGADRSPSAAMGLLGTRLAVWQSTSSPPNGEFSDDKDVVFSWSTNGGLTWSLPQYITPLFGADEGYDGAPVVAINGRNTAIVVWQSSNDLDGVNKSDIDLLGVRIEIPSVFPAGRDKARFISFVVPAEGIGQETALQVELTSLHHPELPENAPDFSGVEGQVRYVNVFRDDVTNNISADCPDSGAFGTSFKCATMGCTPEYLDWATLFGDATLYVSGSTIVPSSRYGVTQLPASCTGNEAECIPVSGFLPIITARWGDADGDALVTISDVVGVIDRVKDIMNSPLAEPNTYVRNEVLDPINNSPNVTDIVLHVDALKLLPYPFGIAACQ